MTPGCIDARGGHAAPGILRGAGGRRGTSSMSQQGYTMAANTPALHEVVDGLSLKQRLAKAERRNKVRAFLLVVPLLLFIGFTFIAPICFMMVRSFYDPLVSEVYPETLAVLQAWDPAKEELPPESAFATIARETARAYESRDLGRVATRLNYDLSGMRSLNMKTGRRTSRMLKKGETPASWREVLVKIDKDWQDPRYWATLKHAGSTYTANFYLKAVDLQYDVHKNIVPVAKNKQLYLLLGWDSVWMRTLWISFMVTALCVLLGYPVAYLLANLPLRTSNLLMILVLLPFWTSLLVRTTAWIVVLQTEGVLNDALVNACVPFTDWCLLSDRVQLIFNRFGVLISMTHILLPFMILPIYSVMKNIPPSYERAARSLGATPWTAFWKVYFPQSVAGIGAGGLLVFILALGYYITPALVGGPTDQLVSYFIADHTNRSLNWGLASALGGVLLASVLAVYVLYDRLVGIDNMKLG
jgi:putative spermidine/putrescine transport system permease protein